MAPETLREMRIIAEKTHLLTMQVLIDRELETAVCRSSIEAPSTRRD